ncbi:unnamed protein product [Prunus brigantina]
MSTPRYPQCNGQEEPSNKLVLDCLKNRLEDTKGKWVDKLPRVLWAYRSTKRRSASETPFFLIYRTEEIIPPHITIPSMRNEVGSLDQNYEQIKVNIDLLEEERERAIVKVAAYQQHLTSYYNKRAKVKQFQPRYLVLRKAFNTTQRQGRRNSKKVRVFQKKCSRKVPKCMKGDARRHPKRLKGDIDHLPKRPKGDISNRHNILTET